LLPGRHRACRSCAPRQGRRMLAAPSNNMRPERHVTLVTRRISDVVQRYDWLLLVREIMVSPVSVASRSSSSNYPALRGRCEGASGLRIRRGRGARLANRASVFEVAQSSGLPGGRGDAAAYWPAEQAKSTVDVGQPVVGDLRLLQDDAGKGRPIERAAAEQEPHPSRPAGSGTQEIHADQLAATQVQAAFLPRLASASLPGRLAVRLDNPARDGPSGLVRRLEDQQSTRAVPNERAR
jgi:hypothetical protein